MSSTPAKRQGGQHLREIVRRWQAQRRRRSSLYARVVIVNAAVMIGALLLLLLTPVTISSRPSGQQVILLVVTLVVLVVADATMIKFSFTGLTALVQRMDTLDVLRPRERLPELGGAETRNLISGYNSMLDRLESERRASTARNIAILENERQRISRELHDELGQRVTGILLHLEGIHDEADETARPRIVRVQDEARAVIDQIGALAWQMRPEILDNLGLLSVLKTLAASLGGSEGPRMDTVLPLRLPQMNDEAELAVYRVAQEALTNAVRHSGATTITLEMTVTDADLVLQVTDDGRGLPGGGDEGPGLRGMRERALLVGGRLRVQQNPPHGLRVELAVPTGPPVRP